MPNASSTRASGARAAHETGGAGPCPSRSRPIDLVHLAAQTLGDRALEREILGLLDRQIAIFLGKLGPASDEERRQIAHAMRGAARNVGAFRLAAAAEALEEGGCPEEALGRFVDELRQAAAFIGALRRD